jgi:Zn-dependent M16 (insulinase) family peptidase
VKLDNQSRFKQMVLETKAGLESGLVPAGHNMVDTRLRSSFNEADWADDQMSGINYLFFLRRLADEVDQDWPAVLAKLESIRQILLNRNSMLCNVTLDATNWATFQPQLHNFLAAFPAGPVTIADWPLEAQNGHEGLTIPAQVNYVGKGANLFDLGYRLHGSHLAITNYLRTTWLWEKVRVQGGAYGGFCRFDSHSGVFSYLSYRDPNLLGTLDNYDAASRFLNEVDISRDEVTKSIIGGISMLDAYQLPDAKGYTSMLRYLLEISDEQRQQRREELLATTVDHFRDFAAVLTEVNQHGRVVVMGSTEAVSEANDARNNWLTIQPVL